MFVELGTGREESVRCLSDLVQKERKVYDVWQTSYRNSEKCTVFGKHSTEKAKIV